MFTIYLTSNKIFYHNGILLTCREAFPSLKSKIDNFITMHTSTIHHYQEIETWNVNLMRKVMIKQYSCKNITLAPIDCYNHHFLDEMNKVAMSIVEKLLIMKASNTNSYPSQFQWNCREDNCEFFPSRLYNVLSLSPPIWLRPWWQRHGFFMVAHSKSTTSTNSWKW